MVCRMVYSPADWTCRISLRYEVDAYGRDLPDVLKVQSGKIITSPSEVEQRIRQAQLMRPYLNPDVCLDDSDKGISPFESILSFSVNCVCVEISRPEVQFLRLGRYVALPVIERLSSAPGIIANVKKDKARTTSHLFRSLLPDTYQSQVASSCWWCHVRVRSRNALRAFHSHLSSRL